MLKNALFFGKKKTEKITATVEQPFLSVELHKLCSSSSDLCRSFFKFVQ